MGNNIKTFLGDDWNDYELLDTGEGKKLERFGKYTFIRPCEEAVWKRTLSKEVWDKANGIFFSSKEGVKKGWKMDNKIDPKWEMSHKKIKFWAWPTPFRHLGFFPEQSSHWSLIEEKIEKAGRKIKFLNLFGYTGVASLFALRAGAEVTHLDASEQTLKTVKENQKLSGLEEMPMRIILDDAIKFIEREARRDNKYDAIIMDPPKHGKGPKGETWEIEKNLPELLNRVRKILSDDPLFVILTSYSTEASSLSIGYALKEMMKDFSGHVEAGELCVLEKSDGKTIPMANTAIWTKD